MTDRDLIKARNARILADLGAGMSAEDVSKKYGLTKTYIHKIRRDACAAGPPQRYRGRYESFGAVLRLNSQVDGPVAMSPTEREMLRNRILYALRKGIESTAEEIIGHCKITPERFYAVVRWPGVRYDRETGRYRAARTEAVGRQDSEGMRKER